MTMDEIINGLDFTPQIMVIDDEKRIRDVCYSMLTQEGFHVDRAENGEAGLEMLKVGHYDIVLLDLMMPGLSGLEVLPQVRNISPETVIIVITGYATIEHSIDAMKNGAFDFIPKPFSPQDLRMVVAKALRFMQTLQDIATEKSRMRTIFDHLADGVLTTDNTKKAALVNPAFLTMNHYSGWEAVGRPVADIIEHEKVLEMIDRCLEMSEKENAEITDEVVCIPKKGSADCGDEEEKIIGVRCVPFRGRMGRNMGAVTVMQDITAIKKMDQLKSDFVSMVAHEIKSPMNSILMQLKIIMDGLAGDVSEKQTEILSRASSKINSLIDLSTELLDLAKIESGLINQEKERLDIADLLAEQVKLHKDKASSQGIVLIQDVDADLPPVTGNRINIDEVISNLIENAIRYSPQGGDIIVSADCKNDYLRIHVKDSGIGISKEDQDRIFDRFYRVKNEKTRYITGTGLGLAIVKSIVEAHNGMIHVESESGKGSRFTISLPK